MGEDLLGLKKSWTEALDRLQQPLRKELGEVRDRIDLILRADFDPVNKTINHLFSRSGKMIRPTLLLLVADHDLCTGHDLVSVAAAVEIIHTASLVHDDSIDSSTHRRGVETLNSKWNHKTSVIIGDYLLAQAFSVISGLGRPMLVNEMSTACRSLALGEMRQMSMEGNLEATEQDYYDFIREKTASLFSATCAVATMLGNGEDLEVLKKFGGVFGAIFQITDDLLDYVGSTPDTGKPTHLDLRDRKMTLPLIHALSRMDAASHEEVRLLFSGSEIDEGQAGRLACLVETFGGIEYAMERVVELADEAADLAAGISNRACAKKLKELVELIVERDR